MSLRGLHSLRCCRHASVGKPVGEQSAKRVSGSSTSAVSTVPSWRHVIGTRSRSSWQADESEMRTARAHLPCSRFSLSPEDSKPAGSAPRVWRRPERETRDSPNWWQYHTAVQSESDSRSDGDTAGFLLWGNGYIGVMRGVKGWGAARGKSKS